MTSNSDLTIKKFYQTLFDSGQTTCFSEKAFGTSVYHIDNIQEIYPNYSRLMYFSVNSLHTHRFDENVTCYRNFLIENDKIELIPEQIKLVKKIGMPYSTVTYSGSKSLHFVISLETPLESEKLYRFVADWIHNIINKDLPKELRFDDKTKNPSRFTRVPGGTNLKYEKDKEGNFLLDVNGHQIVKSKTVQSLLDIKGRVPDTTMEDWLLSHQDCKPTVHEHDNVVLSDTANPLLLKPWTVYVLENGIHEGKRNTTFYEIGRDLAKCGFNLDEAIKYIHDNAKNIGDFSPREIESAIKSAFKAFTRGIDVTPET